MENNSNTEIKKVLVIDTKGAVKSIEDVNDATKQTYSSMKAYKQHIDKLTASLIDLDEESEDYKRTLQDIRQSQERYNNIIRNTKKETDAVVGSYNYLVQKMAELKKAWRATTDEAERNNLGLQINDINNQLKDLDATIGNYQRNVGNYGSAFSQGFKQITDAIGISIPSIRTFGDTIEKSFKAYEGISTVMSAVKGAFGTASKSGGAVSETIAKQNKLVQQNTNNLEKLTNQTKNWQKAEVAIEGASAAVNVQLGNQARLATRDAAATATLTLNASKLEKAFAGGATTAQLLAKECNVSLHTARIFLNQMSANGLTATNAINETAEATTVASGKFKQFTDSLKKMGTSLKEFFTSTKVAIVAVLLAVVEAIKLINQLIDQHNQKIEEANKKEIEWLQSLKDTNTALLGLGSTAASARIQFALLGEEYRNLGDDAAAKEQFLAKYKDTITSTLFPVKSVNDLEEAFIKNTDKYKRAIIARAEQQAAYNLLIKEYEQYLADTLQFEGIKREDLTPLDQEKLDKATERWNDFSQRILATYKRTTTIINSSGIYAYTPQKETTTSTTTTTSTSKKVSDIDDLIARYKYLQETVDNNTEKYYKYAKEIENLEWQKAEARLQAEQYTNETIEAARQAHNARLAEIDSKIAGLNAPTPTEELKQSIDDKLKALDEESAARIFIIDKTTQYEYDANKKILDINRETLLEKKKLLTDELSLLDKSSDNYKLYSDKLAAVDAEITNNAHQRVLAVANEVAKEAEMFGSATANIFNSIASMYEEGSEEYKGLATAGATISMLQGVVSAIAGAFQLGPILGPIYGAINAASVIAAGIANIKKIQETTLDSTPSSPVVPAANTFKPAYATNLTASSDISQLSTSMSDAMTKQNIYVSVTDINNMQNKVRVTEENSTF